MTRAIGLLLRTWLRRMIDLPLVVLPTLLGGQAESWAGLVELAPAFGNNWLLVGGQMVAPGPTNVWGFTVEREEGRGTVEARTRKRVLVERGEGIEKVPLTVREV